MGATPAEAAQEAAVVPILPVVQVAAIQVAAVAVHQEVVVAVHLAEEVLHPDVVN